MQLMGHGGRGEVFAVQITPGPSYKTDKVSISGLDEWLAVVVGTRHDRVPSGECLIGEELGRV